ncbi:MAG: 2OG-Fe(II) oxygenase family protein [Pseudomonadota bacterium]
MPTVDLGCGAGEPEGLSTLAQTLDAALTSTGFIALRNARVPAAVEAAAFAAARAFFAEPLSTKARFGYSSAAANFGYQAPLTEALDPAVAPDLKESFTMRDLRHRTRDAGWPSAGFQRAAEAMYDACFDASMLLLRVFAVALGEAPDFFTRLHSGENATLRFLHYPAAGLERSDAEQMGAGAHTDYGALTLLFQRGVGGLQLKPEGSSSWIDVPPVAGAVNVNTGDLMTHWSNGRYPSTLHRVQPKLGTEDRFSIAFFCDPDADAPVICLPQCVSADRPARFADTTAGAHIQQRIEASQAHLQLDAEPAARREPVA